MGIQVKFGNHNTFHKGHHLFNNENKITFIWLIELIPHMGFYEQIICILLFILPNNPIRQNYFYVQCTYEKKKINLSTFTQ